MNPANAYDLCNKYMGRRVCITDNQGRKHVGRITKVDNECVWIMPDGPGSYGIGFWGFGRPGFGYGLALGVVTGLVLAPLFFF